MLRLLRCTSTGRLCDGYVTNSQSLIQVKPVNILPKAILTTITGSSKDEVHLDFFSKVTAPKIAGFYDDLDFWKSTVVQLGHKEPAIRLAIQAVTGLHAEVEKLEGNRVKEVDPLILKNYNDAIHHLVQGSKDPLYVKAVVVALFVCIEFLTGNEEAAAIHINGGLKLLEDWRNRSMVSSPSDSSSSTGSPKSASNTNSENDLMDELTATFSRLAVHSKVFGKRMFQLQWSAEDDSSQQQYHFDSITRARNEGFIILSEAIGFVSRATPVSYSSEGAPEKWTVEQRFLVGRIVAWRRAYKDFARRNQMTMTQMQIRGGNMISCLILCGYVWCNTCLSPYEEDYDRYTEEFQEVIDLARSIIDIPEEYLCANIGRFQLDMGLVPSLHLVGARCRVPSIRKAAMDMLSTHHWREGLFDSYRSAEFIAICTHLEEQRKQELMGLKDSELADYLPCEGARIHFVGVDEEDDGPHADTLVHSFYTKPYGAFGDWHVQQCILPANPSVVSLEERAASNIRPVPNSAYHMPNIYSGSAYPGSFNPEIVAAKMEKTRAFVLPSDVTQTFTEKTNGMFYMHLTGMNVAVHPYMRPPRRDHDVLII